MNKVLRVPRMEVRGDLILYPHPTRADTACLYSPMQIARDFNPAEHGYEADAPILAFLGSSASEDRYGSVVEPRGMRERAFLANPVFLWAHIYTLPPIGRTLRLDRSARGPVFHNLFAVQHNELASVAYRMYRDDFLRGVSLGFIPLEWEDYETKSIPQQWGENVRYTDWELLEHSAAPVPANRDALKLALSENRYTENEMRAVGLDSWLRDSTPYLLSSLIRVPAPIVEPPAAASTEPDLRLAAARSFAELMRTALAGGDIDKADAPAAEVLLAVVREQVDTRAGAVLNKKNKELLQGCRDAMTRLMDDLDAAGQMVDEVLASAEKPESPADAEEQESAPKIDIAAIAKSIIGAEGVGGTALG